MTDRIDNLKESLEKVAIEEIAKLIYPSMKWMWDQFPGGDIPIPEWVDGGNSFVQEECRRAETLILSALIEQEGEA